MILSFILPPWNSVSKTGQYYPPETTKSSQPTKNGGTQDNDKAHFSKAASGFAHQEASVLVRGIEARENADGIDEAIALKPMPT
jgi:hypothetical protein